MHLPKRENPVFSRVLEVLGHRVWQKIRTFAISSVGLIDALFSLEIMQI
jgi:hypothetical protein